MTVIAQPLTEQRVLALRVADLNPPEHAILAVVWKAWADYQLASIREIADAVAYAPSAVHGYTYGIQRKHWRRSGLVQRGWLKQDGQRGRTLRPGPRMAGVQGGKVLELA